MGSFFVTEFEPSVKLNEIKEKPIEHGRRYLSEFFAYFGIADEEKIRAAITLFEPRIYKRETFFITAGEVAGKIGFIVHGAVEAYYINNASKQTLMFLMEEDFFTDLKSFIHQRPSGLSLQFAEDTIVLEIGYENFKNFMLVHQDFAEMFIKIMSNVVSAMNEHNLLLKMPTRKRYELLLRKKPQVFNRFLLRDIASFLGIKQETLSRARSNYKKKVKAER
ncbi:MAG TPA: Crp/Fnr family transcriptional regulator [Chitinophagaceae bacterium]|nr:Crp/Fnr family transcriptional regulator [Chitinophagaceae bacterium]